jgi:hypothetical protein
MVKAPRMLYLHWPFGHALGEPNNRLQQRTVLHDVFSMARLAPHSGLIVDLPYQWRRSVYQPIGDWTKESGNFSKAFEQALQAENDALRL